MHRLTPDILGFYFFSRIVEKSLYAYGRKKGKLFYAYINYCHVY